MILVTATADNGSEIVRLKVDFLYQIEHDKARYSVQVVTDRGSAIGIHQRAFIYNFRRNNPLALIMMALQTLDEESFEAEHGETRPPDMARQERGALREIQARASRLYHYRSPVRGGQSEQPSSDGGGEEVREEDRQRRDT